MSRSRSRDRGGGGGRDRDRGSERRYQIKYRYWDVPPAGYEHMTPKEYKELQGFWAFGVFPKLFHKIEFPVFMAVN
jgi:hypothetical protein